MYLNSPFSNAGCNMFFGQQPGPEVIQNQCSAQLNMKCSILFHAHKQQMATIVGILTFISMINTTSKSLKARNVF